MVILRQIQTRIFLSVAGISEELEAQVLEMPFKGKRASMYVFLPQDQNNGRELDNMLKRMNPGSLLSAMRILDRRDVVINFPKFKYEKCLGSELRLVSICIRFSRIEDYLTGYNEVKICYVSWFVKYRCSKKY